MFGIRQVRVGGPAAVVVMAVGIAPAGAAAKAKLPDLRVTAKAPAATVVPGKKVTIALALRNEGKGKAGATTTRISLGTSPTAFAKGDRVLATVRQKAVGRGGQATAKVTFTVPRTAGRAAAARRAATAGTARTARTAGRRKAPKARYVLACADSGRRVRESSEGDNCTKVARVDGKGASGTVDAQGAKQPAAAPAPPVIVKAPTDEPRTPYTDDPLKSCQLKTGPKVPDLEPIKDWDNTLFAGADARIWWPKSRAGTMKAEADALGKELTATIYPRLTKLMGREPISDAAVNCSHGPDGRLDIFLVDQIGKLLPGEVKDGESGTLGSTQPYTCAKNAPNSSYVFLARRDKETLAHEFFHVLQNLFPYKDCTRQPWLDEGTAEWAVEHTYPHSIKNSTSTQWLNVYQPSLLSRSYDAWPFWYDVTKKVGTAAIPQAYKNLATMEQVPAVDAAISQGDDPEGKGNGFRARWPQFARDAYNHDMVDDAFKTAGWTLTDTHVTDQLWEQNLGTFETTRKVPIPGSRELAPLVRHYDRHFYESAVRSITVQDLPNDPDYRLHALIYFNNGGTQEVDLHNGDTWCRDKPGQNVAEIDFISSNASPTRTLSTNASLRLADNCGLPHYRVLASSFSVSTEGTMSGQYCGTVHGTEDYGGQLSGPLADDFTLARDSAGTLTSSVVFPVRVVGSQTFDGCKDDKKECHESPPYSMNHYSQQVGVDFTVATAQPTVARVRFNVAQASIGTIDTGDEVCNVFNFYNIVSDADRTIDVPVDQVMRGTHTFHHSGTSSWTVDEQTGKPAALSMGWDYSVTIQVVDDAGNPIE
jgi:CARDB